MDLIFKLRGHPSRSNRLAICRVYVVLAEGTPLQLALGQVIRAMGVVEYAKKIGIAASNLHRIQRSKANPTLDTLQMLLSPLGLQISVIEKGSTGKKWAALKRRRLGFSQ